MRPIFILAAVAALAGAPWVAEASDWKAGAEAKVAPRFLPLAPGAVAPEGWLKDWAQSAARGITGHLDEYSKTFGEAWKGHPFEARGVLPDGTGWPLEQSSYWLDGAVRLAAMLHDKPLMDKVSRRLDLVVSGVRNGGPTFIYWRPKSAVDDVFNNWAHSHMGRALVAYYRATRDPRVLEALVKVYSEYPLPDPRDDFDSVNGAVNLDPMTDTYLLSGDRGVLARIDAYAQRAAYRRVAAEWGEGRLKPGHNVVFYEDIRVPALLYPWTGDSRDLAATLRGLEWDDRQNLLPMGLGSGEEYHAGIGATRNVETCNVAASMWTWLWLLRITGDGGWSDRIERVFFNAGPAPVARDFRTMCYYQSPNRYSAGNPKEEPQNPGAGSYQFTPIGHSVLCCVGNLNRVIPNYVTHMWMTTGDGGLAAVLYGPSSAESRVAGGVAVRVNETTSYPFDDTITLALHPEKPAAFPLHLRLPGWCRKPEVRVNGRQVDEKPRDGFLRIARTWSEGDRVTLRLPMSVTVTGGRETPYPAIPYFDKGRKIAKVRDVHSPWASVSYGPLLFALPIPDITPNEEAPGARYSYALDLPPGDPQAGVRVERKAMPAAWNWELDSPLRLRVRAREFDWTPAELSPLPPDVVRGGKPAEVTLVPYGCTKFRVSMFPVSDKSQLLFGGFRSTIPGLVKVRNGGAGE